MRVFYYIMLLGLLTACSEELKVSAPEPTPEQLKLINEVKNEVIDKKSSGIEKVERKAVANSQKTVSSIVLPSVDPLELNGNLAISGSQVVLPVSRSIAQRFMDNGFPGDINLSGLTTTKGLKILCEQGKLDIVNASRTIDRDESATCYKFGRQPIGFPVANDAVTLVVGGQNTFLPNSLTKEQLRKIFISKKWSDVNPSWPNQEIKRVFPNGPGGNGGFDLMANYLTLENGGKELAKNPQTLFYDFVEQLHSQALIDPYMFGMSEYPNYSKNKDVLRAIAIEGVEPSNPLYPVTRTLYIYADAKQIKQRPELQGFLNYYFTYSNKELKNLGFFPVSETLLNASKTKLLDMVGTPQ